MRKRGYNIIPESARSIIVEQQATNEKILPWINLDKFQKEVLKRQLKAESRLDANLTYFLDRGIPDSIAYYRIEGLSSPEELIKVASDNKYDGVFFLERLDIHEKDRERTEDFEKSTRIHELIKEVYQNLGYGLIDVPAHTIEKRAELILKAIKTKNN